MLIGLVVTEDGFPLGYEVFAGNRHDSTTVDEMVTSMEQKYGRANRIWVMDRGMVSEEKIARLHRSARRTSSVRPRPCCGGLSGN